MHAAKILIAQSSFSRRGAASKCRKKYWEVKVRKIISTQTAGIASCEIEKDFAISGSLHILLQKPISDSWQCLWIVVLEKQ